MFLSVQGLIHDQLLEEGGFEQQEGWEATKWIRTWLVLIIQKNFQRAERIQYCNDNARFPEWLKEYQKNKLGSQRKTSQSFFVSIKSSDWDSGFVSFYHDISPGRSIRNDGKGGDARETEADGE